MSSMPKISQENAESTIGAILAAAREKKGVPVEKAARDTRIRTSRLKELEADDFSQFSHPNYARMFLLDYAKYLGVPAPSIKSLLPERGECGAEGYQYLQDNPSEAVLSPQRLTPKRRRLLPALITLASVLILAFLGMQIVIFKTKFDRINSPSNPALESQIREDKAVLENEILNAAPATETASTTERAPAPAETVQTPLYVGAPEHKPDNLQ